MSNIPKLEAFIADVRAQLADHQVYKNLNTIPDIKLFMEDHVFAVWDFMSLLKALQNLLTTTSTPWKPSNNPKTCRFINEIVLGEESDLNESKVPMSHFEMYLEAMQQIGATSSEIEKLINNISDESSVIPLIEQCEIQEETKNFVRFTFDVIHSQKPHCIASAFTFGREDIIPEMFLEILKNTDHKAANFSKLKYYLERHIELDGDEHGPLSLQMIEELCGSDETKWREVEIIARESIAKSIDLWNGVNKRLITSKENALSY